MAISRRIKAPKVKQGQPTMSSKGKSSTKKPKPHGISPGKPAYGIVNTSRSSGPGDGTNPKGAGRITSLFGVSQNPGDNQSQLARKAPRQVY